jgi:hypothetical protein
MNGISRKHAVFAKNYSSLHQNGYIKRELELKLYTIAHGLVTGRQKRHKKKNTEKASVSAIIAEKSNQY